MIMTGMQGKTQTENILKSGLRQIACKQIIISRQWLRFSYPLLSFLCMAGFLVDMTAYLDYLTLQTLKCDTPPQAHFLLVLFNKVFTASCLILVWVFFGCFLSGNKDYFNSNRSAEKQCL